MLPIFLFFPSGFSTEPPSFVRNKRHSCSSGEPRADQCCPVLFHSHCSSGGNPRQEPTVSQANELSEIRLRPSPPGQVIIMRAVRVGEDGASCPFCSQRGAANLFTGDQRGAVGTGLPCKRPPRTTIQVGSWRAQRACL